MKVVVLNGKGFVGFVLRHMFGIKKLHAANPQLVDVAKLKMRAYGALIAALAYFVCKKLA